MKKLSAFLVAFFGQFLFVAYAMAEEASGAGSSGGSLVAIGAGICMGMAALGGTLGQGRAVASALEGVARNPGAASKVQTPMILGLALIESLVLFSFVIAIMLVGKV
ncbi:MAG TPA: ATP synthase F0 subunit C [Deltaproteobacteria bacterium]|nr:MAG: ATP synthase F0 subunit C [Deltaproteobacteria bacterium GWA2_45_12]HBF12463.1 ATP synthase F0 subunit C [Deltaproteobacteria bacterium]